MVLQIARQVVQPLAPSRHADHPAIRISPQRVLVDFCRQAERRCADAAQPSFGGIPEAGGALPRFGLDIGVERRVGWMVRTAVRGHENFFLGKQK
jgi:hypothetical protein